jgi:uncharacterized protein involved in exopolysaccharide biosynthesis
MKNGNNLNVQEEVRIFIYWRMIKKWRKLIGIFVAACVLLTMIISLFLNNIYAAKAIIIPVASREMGGSGMAATLMQQVGGLPGISLPESVSETEIITLLKSITLREEIITRHNLLPVLFPEKWDKKTKTWRKNWSFILNPFFLAERLRAFISPADKSVPAHEDGVPTVWDGLRKLDKTVNVISNRKEKNITISVEAEDPVLAAQIVGYFLAALNEYMSGEAKRVAMINRKYLEEQLMQTADPYIQQKIYNMIAQQIETSMMAEVKENFSFKVLERPKAPDKKIRPKRSLMVLISLAVSLLLAGFFVAFMAYMESLKTNKNQINVGACSDEK